MMIEEFEKMSGKKISDAAWDMIEFVYTFHPLISETSGKEQVVYLYNNLGIHIFEEMTPKAIEAQELESKIFEIRRELSGLEEQLRALKEK